MTKRCPRGAVTWVDGDHNAICAEAGSADKSPGGSSAPSISPNGTNGVQQSEFDCEENPREDMNEQTYYIESSYEPVCLRMEGKGAEPSRVVCKAPAGSQ